ncbi:hypothetical protein ACEN4H_07450 [Leuconostoc mesenteroides]|uniref:hypothetical protein n=1 Tax=Leuconostoc mesenteroides TaxID=1245 RepID=UPI003887EF20
METYYVTKEQLDLIQELKSKSFPIDYLALNSDGYFSPLVSLTRECSSALLRYLGGDEAIEFKVKEQLYRLWRIDDVKVRTYMKFDLAGNPSYTYDENYAFTAPLEVIREWQTPACSMEKVE